MREYEENMSRNDEIYDPKRKKLVLCTYKIATYINFNYFKKP